MSEVKNEGLEVVDVRAIVTDAFLSMVEAALGMKAPDCAPPQFIQSAIDRAIDRINSEALAGYAVRDARIAELEQDLAYFPSTVRSLAETVTERETEINQLRAEIAAAKETIERYETTAENCDLLRGELAAIKGQVPVAWVATANKKGLHDQRSFWNFEAAADEWVVHYVNRGCKVNKFPLYTSPAPSAVVMPERDTLTLAYRLITTGLETLANGSAIDRYKAAQSDLKAMIDYLDEVARLNPAPANAECKKCGGSGRIPIGGAGKEFGLTNRCFECCPVMDADMAAIPAAKEGGV